MTLCFCLHTAELLTSYSCYHGDTVLHASFASLQYEPDCPGYPNERYTVDIDGVQVADMTADEFQSRVTDFSNGFVTLSLPLTQRLPEKTLTVNMSKFNTVPTNMSDDMGNIVTEMVTWRTSAVFGEMELSSYIRTYVNLGRSIAYVYSRVYVCICMYICGYNRLHVFDIAVTCILVAACMFASFRYSTGGASANISQFN